MVLYLSAETCPAREWSTREGRMSHSPFKTSRENPAGSLRALHPVVRRSINVTESPGQAPTWCCLTNNRLVRSRFPISKASSSCVLRGSKVFDTVKGHEYTHFHGLERGRIIFNTMKGTFLHETRTLKRPQVAEKCHKRVCCAWRTDLGVTDWKGGRR